MDPDTDPDPAFFVIDLQDANKKQLLFKHFYAYYCLKVHLHKFPKIKSQKESQNQAFSYYFCMIAEGSGSGSIPLTNGSGSGRPQNMWIRWIRIRIRNTGLDNFSIEIFYVLTTVMIRCADT
jgi:hypothetical protein